MAAKANIALAMIKIEHLQGKPWAEICFEQQKMGPDTFSRSKKGAGYIFYAVVQTLCDKRLSGKCIRPLF